MELEELARICGEDPKKWYHLIVSKELWEIEKELLCEKYHLIEIASCECVIKNDEVNVSIIY